MDTLITAFLLCATIIYSPIPEETQYKTFIVSEEYNQSYLYYNFKKDSLFELPDNKQNCYMVIVNYHNCDSNY